LPGETAPPRGGAGSTVSPALPGETAPPRGGAVFTTKRDEIEQVRHLAKQRGVLRPNQLEPLARFEAALVQPLLDLVSRLARNEAKPLALAPILSVLPDASRHLRAAGAVLLTRFESDDARAALLALIDDYDAIVREAAVRAMGAKQRLTREVLAKVLDDPDPSVRHAAVRAVSGGTSSSPTMSTIDLSALAQTTKGMGQAGVYATLDANAAMASLTRIEKMMLIRQVPIFMKLDAEDLEELASIVEERMFDAGQELFREGDVGDAVYLIVKGTLRVFVGGDSVAGGRPETTISEAGAGACIGEMAVLDASPRSASVRAIERTRTLRVPGEGFKRLLSDRPEMSEAIVGELVFRMRGLMAQTTGATRTSGAMSSLPDEPSA
jgi:CRP-like cAMP-binding protein